MKGPFGEKPITHAEKLLLKACARNDKLSAAVRSLRQEIKRAKADAAAASAKTPSEVSQLTTELGNVRADLAKALLRVNALEGEKRALMAEVHRRDEAAGDGGAR